MSSFTASTRRLLVVASLLALTVPTSAGVAAATTSGAAPARPAAVAAGGSYQALTPSRILDTGSGVGATKAAVKGHATLAVSVLGHGGVPSSGVGAVVLNVTAASPTAAGYVTVYPAGAAAPGTSNLNFTAGTTAANLVVVKVGTNGQVDLVNGSSGTLRLVADVEGYYVSGAAGSAGAFTALAPARVLDTATGTGATKAAVAAHGTVALSALGHGGLPSTGVGALVLNLTAASPTSTGYLTAYPAGGPRPTASNLNFVRAQVVPNLVVVPVSSSGQVDIYNGSAGTVRMVADVEGYYLTGVATDPGTFAPLNPARVLDTGSGIGASAGLVAPQATVPLSVLGHGDVPASGVGAVILNLTAVTPASTGYVTAYPAGGSRPATSNLNYARGVTRANLVVVPVGAGGTVDLFNGSGGTVRLIADVEGYYLGTPPPSLSWTGSTIDPPHGGVASIACPSTTMCMVIDGSGNTRLVKNGVWSRPQLLAPGFQQLSCPTTTFCVATSQTAVAIYNGTGWTAPSTIDPGNHLDDVSCPTATFCAVIDVEGNVLTFNGTSWSAPTNIDVASNDLLSVSCTSSTFCMAFDWTGKSIKFNGTTWEAPHDIFGSAVVGRVSCATSTFCVVVVSDLYATYNGASWSAPVDVFGLRATDLTCPASGMCFSVASGDYSIWSLDGGSWTESSRAPGMSPQGIACTSSTACLVTGDGITPSPYNYTATFDSGTWGTVQFIDSDSSGVLWSVSCPTTSFCAAIDNYGSVVRYDGHTWGDAEMIQPADYGTTAGGLSSLSCPRATFCMTVGNAGAQTFNGATWSSPVHVTAYSLTAVSCATPTFCVAYDNNFQYFVYTGSGWSSAQTFDQGSNGVSGISCAAVNHCVVVDGNGRALTYDGSSWSSVTIDPQYPYINAVSCPSVTDCTAIDGQGDAIQLTGTTWVTPTPVDPGGYVRAISCVGPATCQAVDLAGDVIPIKDGVAGSPQKVGTVNQFRSISCATATFCVAVDQQAHGYLGQ